MGEISEKKLKKITDVLNLSAKKPDKIPVDDNFKQKAIEIFYSIYLYFSIHFQKDNVTQMFNDDKICNYLFNSLIEYHNFYENLTLSKDNIINLFRKAKNYNQLLILFSYIGKDFLLLLELLIISKDLILNKFNEESAKLKQNNIKEMPLIEFEKYVEPKRDDNIQCILEKLNKLSNLDIKKLVKISPSLIEKYIDLYNGSNLDNLMTIKKIVIIIQTMIDKKFNIKKDLDKIIHENGIIFSKKGQLKNIKLLNFIQQDDYYTNEKCNNNIFRSLDILDGIDVSALKEEKEKEEFFKKWKNFDFYKMFETQKSEFLKKIASLIKEIKYFEFLFKLYDMENDPKKECIEEVQKRFGELIQTYPKCSQQLVDLICKYDETNINIELFLLQILEKNLVIKDIKDVYIQLINKRSNLSEKCKNFIVYFFTKNY
jgi:predicted transcriptional regulator